MDNIAILQNQLVIMQALAKLLANDPNLSEKLKDQIVFTSARIRALS